jgi:hypothetical protein
MKLNRSLFITYINLINSSNVTYSFEIFCAPALHPKSYEYKGMGCTCTRCTRGSGIPDQTLGNPPCRLSRTSAFGDISIFTPLECKKIYVMDPSGRDLTPSGSAFLHFNPSGDSIFLPFSLEKMTNYPAWKLRSSTGGFWY